MAVRVRFRSHRFPCREKALRLIPVNAMKAALGEQ